LRPGFHRIRLPKRPSADENTEFILAELSIDCSPLRRKDAIGTHEHAARVKYQAYSPVSQPNYDKALNMPPPASRGFAYSLAASKFRQLPLPDAPKKSPTNNALHKMPLYFEVRCNISYASIEREHLIGFTFAERARCYQP